ncbi:hypothetical protein ACZ87_02670 [Candidatus Erwinia dacicola]|uniref:Uncharacterized protein n=1 Tax=Candidatus Erwinia dacicola TaxID=252393 RepID=A0A2T6MNA2_9GAMM|nr:hypothetical protein ACZ87_03776 [Candidatus Erwinia dacicola]RAP70522.1 hypothetical protein ACZ87_02670 [Candidatus Erwinia dacicola]
MARVVLGFAITQQWFPGQWKVQVIGLESGLGAPAGQSSAAGTVGPPQLMVISNMELTDNRNIRMTSTIGDH